MFRRRIAPVRVKTGAGMQAREAGLDKLDRRGEPYQRAAADGLAQGYSTEVRWA